MNPKMTLKDAAHFLEISTKQAHKTLVDLELPFYKAQNTVYFGHSTAKQLFKLEKEPTAIAFQIVKGGTGKTSLASAFAIRASLYGLQVLCIDLDQQGNLTQTFHIDAENLPVMVDILAEGYSYESAITRVYPGLDLLSSRLENALIDDVIKLKQLSLEDVYGKPIVELKKYYDVIVIDCPPNLGQSVASVTLGVDQIIAPVVPENFALAGLKATSTTIEELKETYDTKVKFGIVLNKYDGRTLLSQDALQKLCKHHIYQAHLLKTHVRNSQEFPNVIAHGHSLYDTVKPTIAKTDIDNLTREVLGIGKVMIKQKSSRSNKETATTA